MPTKAMLRIHGAFLGALLFVAACTSESLDVGETDAGTPTPPGSQGGVGGYGGKGAVSAGVGGVIYTTLPSWPAPTDCVESSNLDIVGVWEGAIRDFDFEPLVPLRLQILGASEAGGVCGTLRWGVGSPPPPPTGPDQNYPADYDFEVRRWPGEFYEGAFYTLMQAGVSGDRLHFGIMTSELWKNWCALQTPYFHPDSKRYECVPYQGGTEAPPGPISCEARCVLCGSFSACICSPDACTADPTYADVAFDLGVDANQIQGNLVVSPGFFEEFDVRMTDVLFTRLE